MLKLQLTRDGAYDDEYLELPATLADVGEVEADKVLLVALYAIFRHGVPFGAEGVLSADTG